MCLQATMLGLVIPVPSISSLAPFSLNIAYIREAGSAGWC